MARQRRKRQPAVTIILVGIDMPDPLAITTPEPPAMTTRHGPPPRGRWFKRRQSKLWKHLPGEEQ